MQENLLVFNEVVKLLGEKKTFAFPNQTVCLASLFSFVVQHDHIQIISTTGKAFTILLKTRGTEQFAN